LRASSAFWRGVREAIAHRQPEDSRKEFSLMVIDRWHGQPIRKIQGNCSFTFHSR
jgi:hypothetical protein